MPSLLLLRVQYGRNSECPGMSDRAANRRRVRESDVLVSIVPVVRTQGTKMRKQGSLLSMPRRDPWTKDIIRVQMASQL